MMKLTRAVCGVALGLALMSPGVASAALDLPDGSFAVANMAPPEPDPTPPPAIPAEPTPPEVAPDQPPAPELPPPPDVPAEMPQVDLIIDAVDRSLIIAVRSIATPPTVTINVIMASTPDVIEVGPLVYEGVAVDYNATEVRIRLEVERILSEPWPANLFTPSNAPLLFQAVAA